MDPGSGGAGPRKARSERRWKGHTSRWGRSTQVPRAPPPAPPRRRLSPLGPRSTSRAAAAAMHAAEAELRHRRLVHHGAAHPSAGRAVHQARGVQQLPLGSLECGASGRRRNTRGGGAQWPRACQGDRRAARAPRPPPAAGRQPLPAGGGQVAPPIAHCRAPAARGREPAGGRAEGLGVVQGTRRPAGRPAGRGRCCWIPATTCA